MVNFPLLSKYPTILFGCGLFNKINVFASKYGKNALIVFADNSFTEIIKSKIDISLKIKNINTYYEKTSHEPSPEIIDSFVNSYKNKHIDVVIAVGGGSVIDTGKALSAMLKAEGSIVNYLEDIGTKEHTGDKIPFIAIPTTAGTGSEMTKNAVISKIGINGFKKSLRHVNFIPDVAIVDPEMTLTCSPDITAASGMDAFTQLLESYISTAATEFTDPIAYSGLIKTSRSLIKSYINGKDINARTDMSYAAMVSGITLANAGLGIVHGFASSIGGLFNIPHGVICGTLMAPSNKFIIEKILKENTENTTINKYLKVARLFVKDDIKDKIILLKNFTEFLYEISHKLNLPRLSDYGIKSDDLPKISKITSNKNNPCQFSQEEMIKILEERI